MADADKKLSTITGDNISDRTKRYQVNLVRNEIRDIIKLMFKDLVPVINKGQQDAAEAAVKAALAQDAKVLEALFPIDTARKAWQASFTQSARHGIVAMVTRITQSQQPLSTRVYKTSAWVNNQLDRKINSHLARGSSAVELAKDVRKLIKPGTSGGVKYAAMRLARTEINNAFHVMSIQAAQEFPWVEQVEWHLSESHEENPGDLCEVYADNVYPKDGVPLKPHPQCMCFIVLKTMPWDQFTSQLASGAFDDFYEQKYGTHAA